MSSIGVSKRQSASSSAPRFRPSLISRIRGNRNRSSSSTISSSGTSALRLLTKTKKYRSKSGDNDDKVPKQKSGRPSNTIKSIIDEPVVAPAVSPVSVLSNITSSLASFVEDTTTTINSTPSLADSNQNDVQTEIDEEELSVEYNAPSVVSPVSNTPSSGNEEDTTTDEDDAVEEVAITQQSQESTVLSSNDLVSSLSNTSVMETSTDVADIDDGGNGDNALREGTFVCITSNGKYKGKEGIVSKMTAKMVYVTIEGIDKDPRVNKDNVRIIDRGQSTQTAATTLPVANKKSIEITKNQTESSTSFEIEQSIRVINESSDYYGKKGTIVKVNNKMLRISIDGVIGEKSLSKKSVEIISSSSSSNDIQPSSTLSTSRSRNDLQLEILLDCDTGVSSASLATGIVTPTNAIKIDESSNSEVDIVTIKAGKYKGEKGSLIKTLPRTLKVNIKGKKVTVRKTSVVGYENVISKTPVPRKGRAKRTQRSAESIICGSGEDWKVADSTGGGTRFGSRIIQKIRISMKSARDDNTFLSHILGDRVKVVEVPLNADECMDEFDVTVLEDGRSYELMSVKIKEDNDGPSMQYCKKKCARLIYCQTTGPRLEPIDVETMLSDFADFAALSPRKVMARLELLQSPALKLPSGRPGIFFLKAKDACEIECIGNDGCGFISETYLESLLPDSKYRDTIAIQIRFLAPSMGVFKGMLMKRNIAEGPPIQLPPTMKKVAASLTNASDDRACLVITQAGKNPSPLNQYIGRMLDPSLKPPPEKSFNDMLKKKPLNKKNLKDKVDMIPRLLLALGVERDTLNSYLKDSLKMSGLAHAYVVGVAEPTGAIPAGYVFLTGFSNTSTPNDQIFVTRSPCAKASDARMLPMIKSKPDTMAQSDWDWLNTLPFGAIIFANPKKGVEPLPAQIASGDLDGDRYFVCWDEDILQQVKPDPVVEITVNVKGGSAEKSGKKPCYDWLKEAQKLMVDSVSVQDIGALTGCLYKLAERTADDSKLNMRDPDAIAFAEAYNQALEFSKHGGTISLPLHLHEKVPTRLRDHLSPST